MTFRMKEICCGVVDAPTPYQAGVMCGTLRDDPDNGKYVKNGFGENVFYWTPLGRERCWQRLKSCGFQLRRDEEETSQIAADDHKTEPRWYWKRTYNGNAALVNDVAGCTVFQTPDGDYKFVIEGEFSADRYDDMEDAKQAAEEAVAALRT